MPRLAIIGPGAIGGSVAAALTENRQHDLVLCARRPLAGITVETPQRTLRVESEVLTDPAAATPVDWVLVATKAYDADSAAPWLARLRRPDTRVAVLQNGVEHLARFAPHVPADQIVPVVVNLPAERVEPTLIRQRGPGVLTVASDSGGRAFAALFAGTAMELVLTDDFKSAAWRKLCLNAAGIVSALLLQPSGIMRREDVADVARGIIREGIAVGRAEGAVLEDELAETIVNTYRQAPPDGINSLHADRIAGRPMEIDARNGVILRLGHRHGIATPCNQMAVALLTAMTQAGH